MTGQTGSLRTNDTLAARAERVLTQIARSTTVPITYAQLAGLITRLDGESLVSTRNIGRVLDRIATEYPDGWQRYLTAFVVSAETGEVSSGYGRTGDFPPPDQARRLAHEAATRFDADLLPQVGDQFRRGGDYKPHLRALEAFAFGDPTLTGHVKALTHLGWVRAGGMNTTSPTPSTAFLTADRAGLPAECWTVGEPAGPQIAANLRALADAGAPEEAVANLWAAYRGDSAV